MDNKRKQLYNNLIGTGRVSDVEIGSLDEFQNAIKDERTARQFHKNLLGAGFTNDEIGTEDEFYNSISSDFLNDNEPDPFDANVERAKNGEPIQRVSTQSMINAHPELGLKNIPNLPTLKEQVEKSNVRDGKLVFGKPGFNGNEVSALYPMSSETLSNRLSDPRILDKDMSIRSVNEADEEKKIDAFFHSKPMKTAKDVYDNYSARFSNTERGIELGEELSDISRTITDKYANEYFNSDSYKELAKLYQGEELAKKANEEFQKTYGYTIDKELKPYQDAYNNELSIRYGSNMDEALRSIAKESVSGKLNSLTGEVESMLKDSEEKLKQHRSSNGKGLNAIMGNQQYLNDTKSQRKERNMLESAQELLDESQNIVNEASKKGNTTFIEGLARGFWDNLNAEDFTFGLAELADMKYLNEALKKAEQGEQLTPAEEKLLEASTINMATQAYFSSDLGRGYKAGSVTAESIPFMLEFIANPISGSGNAIAKGLLKFGLKRFGKSMTSKTAKAVGRLIGDATAAVGMTSTTGMPSVLAETYNRLNRNYKYGVGEDGGLYVNKEGDTSFGEAFGKSFTTRALENQSEMIFHAFKGAGNLLKGVDATLPGGVNKFFDYIKNSKVGELWRGIKNSPLRKELAEATKVGGIGEEYLEEVYNNFANVALGEMSMEEALNLDNNIDTFLGLAPTQVMFSMLGLGNMAALRYKTRRDIEDLRATMNESQRQALDGLLAMGTTATNQDVREFIRNTMANQSLSIDEKRNAVKAAYDVARQKAMADVQEAEVEDKIAEENADIDAKTDPQTGNYGEVTLLGVDESGEPTANPANVFGAKVVDGELYLLVLPEGETEKKWVRPHEYDAESHQIMPGAEVKAYNEQMIRDNAAKQAEQEAKFHESIVNHIPTNTEQTIDNEGNLVTVVSVNGDGVTFIYENGQTNQVPLETWREWMQAEYDRKEMQKPETEEPKQRGTVSTPVALAYLLEGGQNSIENLGYFLHGVAAAFPELENEIESIRGNIGEGLGVSPDRFAEVAPREMAEMRQVIESKYGKEGSTIFDELVANSTGYVPKVGAEMALRLENLKPIQNEGQQPSQEAAPTTEAEATSTPVETEEVTQAEEVQPEVVEEVQQPQQQTPVIPTKEDGSIDFVSYGKDNTFKTLGEKYGEKMPNKVAVTAKALAEDLVKAQEKLAKAEEAYDNAPIGREQKAEQARDKAKAELESIQREADFWSSLDNEIKEAQAKRDALLNPKADIDMSEEPMNADEFIAQQLANGNIALESASYKKETGYGEKERQKFIKMFRKAENGGISIESAGDLLMQMDRENGTNFFDQTDANAGRDALINFLGSVSSWGDVTGYIRNNREAQSAKETEGLRSEMEDAIESNYHMTPEEYATLQEMEATENPFEGVDIEAKDAIFAEAALEYEEYLKSLENGQGTTEEVIEGNGDVLSEEQSDNTGGIEQRQGEGLDVSEGTVQSDDAAQEESAEVAPSIEQTNVSRMADIEARILEIEGRRNEISDELEAVEDTDVMSIAELRSEEYELNQEQAELEAEYIGLRSMNDESNAISESEGSGLYFRTTTKNEEARRKPLRQRAKEWEQKLGVKVNIIENFDDVTNKDAKKAIRNGQRVTGWYEESTGEVCLYMPYLESAQEIDATYIHEVVAHKGLRGLLGDKFDEFLDDVWNAMSEADKLIYLTYPGVNGNKRAAADEYIAHLAENIDVTESAWGKLAELIKKFLKAIGLEPKMTHADIANTIKLSYQRLLSGEGGVDVVGDGTRFSAKKGSVTVSAEEYAKIAHQIATYPQKADRGHVFTDNNYYLCTDIDDEGNFRIVASLKIEGNEELINSLRGKDGQRNFKAIEGTESLASIVEEVKRRGGRTNWNIPTSKRQSRTNGQNDSVHLGKQSKSGTDQQSSDSDDRKPKFRVVTDKNGKKTLVGLHNISENKLRKAIKQGGLANPSVAVIDMDKQSHVDYGDITLVLPASMIDKKTGKNVGTYLADAYTPVYPTVVKKMTDKGYKTFNKALDDVNEFFRSKVRSYFNSYLDTGTIYDALYYWYLSDTGKNPPTLEAALPSDFTREEVEKVKSVNPEADSFYQLSEEEKQKALNLYADKFFGGMKEYENHLSDYTKRMQEVVKDESKPQMVRKNIQENLNAIERYGYEYDRVANYFKRAIFIADRQSKPSDVETFSNARNEVIKNGFEEDFGNWLIAKEEELGVEEKLFAGYDNQGRAKYLPNTLENASKLMKKEGRAGATGLGGFNYFVAILAPVAKTTKQISAKKGNLSTQEEYDKFVEEWKDYYHDLARQLQPGAGKWDDYGYHRLHEIAPMANPKAYVKKEYGIDLSDEFLKDLNDVKNAIKNDFPARYFETKFERPVYLKEVAAAVVPSDMSLDLYGQLQRMGIPMYEYERGNNEARMAVVDKVTIDNEGIRFRFIGERGARNLDKAEEATTRLDNLAVAREMEAAEKDAKTIKMATGWERGADGLWRYETMDSETAIKDGDEVEIRKQIEDIEEEEKSYKKKAKAEGIDEDERYEAYIGFNRRRGFLEAQLAYVMVKNADVLTHIDVSLYHVLDKENSENLFKAYPELEFVRVGFATEIHGKSLGATIINGSKIEAIHLDVKRSTPEELNGYLAHEIQHAIQEIEGFAPGGNPSMESPRKAEQKIKNISFMKDKLNKSVSERNSLLKQRNEINDKMSAWWDAHEDATREDMLADKDMQQYNREYDELSKQIDEADKNVKFNERWLDATLQANTALGYEGYKKLAGEVEARNVSRRMMLSADDRRNMLAVETEDVAREDQIFLKDGIEEGILGKTRFRTLPSMKLRKLEEGEKCNVERVFTQQKMFNFSSNEKIESYEDVAYIFKSLEDEAIENTFVALIKKGKPTIVHLGMGTANQSTIDQQAVIVAIDRIKPDEVYMVHNHPSGNLKASRQDAVLLDSMKKAYGSIVKDGIIINLRSGRYSVFNEEGSYAESNVSIPSKEIPVKTYSFSKRVFDKDFDIQELVNVRSADDANYYAEKHGLVAALTSSQRLGDRDKISLLVIDQSGKIVGNVFLNYADVTPSNMTAISKDVAYYTSAMSGQFAIIFGRMNIKEAGHLNIVVQRVSAGSVKMFDVISVNKDGGYVSAANEGVMEEAVDYANNDTRFRIANQNQEIFVSNAQKAIEGIKQEKGTPQQWLAMIEKNGGLKSGEDKWLGLSDWLKASDAKTITKSEILDFINQNKIQIEEVKYGEGLSDYSNEKLDVFNAEFEELMFEGEEVTGSVYTSDWVDYAYEKMVDSYGDDFRDAFELEGTGTSSHLVPTLDWNDELSGAAKFFLDVESTDRPINNTRLGYTTEGLENKSEIALVVPTIEPYNKSDEIHFGDAGDGRAIAWIRFGETTTPNVAFINAREAVNNYIDEMREKYNVRGGGIYDVMNEDEVKHLQELTSAEFDTRDKVERVLVIDEIQSKRHQEGREKGYRDVANIANIESQIDVLLAEQEQLAKRILREEGYISNDDEFGSDNVYAYKALTGNLGSQEQRQRQKEIDTELYNLNRSIRVASKGVPEAPFEKNWHELAFKRMLRYAAENGFDKVAWTTGEQQADRYGLSKKIDSIEASEWRDYHDALDDGVVNKEVLIYVPIFDEVWEYAVDKEGKILWDFNKQYTGENIANLLGKEIAVRLLSDGKVKLEGDGLRIGGEGMKGFYDKMLPSFVNKYVKKWGTKVQDIELPELEEAGRIMHSVDVTDAMKESVMEGQTMFRIAPQEEVQAEVDKFTSKYNGKEVVVLNSTVSDEELEILGLDVEDVREAIEKETEGFYDPITDKIYIFADIADADELEKTLFHENGHGIFRKNKKFVNEFNENSKDKFKKGREDIAKYYKEHERAEELFVRIFDQELTSGNFEYLPKYLSEELWNEFNDILKDFGYDRQEESDRRRKGSVVRTETDRGSEKKAAMRNGSVEPNQREERKEKGSSKEQAERLKKLFDDVADMGLEGVLGNKAYNKAVLDIYSAIPESVRVDIANDALSHYEGDIAPAVSDYLNVKAKANLWDKVIAIIRDALRNIGIDVELNQNDVKYLLWRSRKPLDRNSIFDMAEDVDMKRKLNVGKFDNSPTDGGDTPGGGTRFRTSSEIDNQYPNWLDGTTTESGKHSTQVEGTRKTYNKIGTWIEENLGKDISILDASSGMGYGTSDLRERGFNIEDVEPYQSDERKANNPATYSSYNDINKQYDFIISNAVLNVIPDDWRQNVLHDMASRLKDGGRMFINTRKAGEEKAIKDKIELDSPQEVLVKRNGKIASYQKFFTPSELKEWVETELGNSYKVEIANRNNSGTNGLAAVVVTKVTETYNGGTRFRVAKEQIDIADERTEIIKKYDKELESKMFNFQEAFQDRMLSLKVLMDLIENETGKKAKSFEDAYTAENQLGSINRPAQLKWLDEFYKPLLEELNKLSKKYGQKEIERYIYCKSGLERNEVLRQRDADETFEAAKAELDEKLAKNQIDQAQYQILLQQADDERKKTLATDTDYSGIRGLLMNTRADDLYDQYVRGVITEAKYKQEVADLKKNEEKVIKDWKQFAENQVANIEKKAEKAELDALWDKINAATNETLRIDFESGMIDRDTYNAEKKMMKYYVPLRNWENTTAEEMYEYRHDMTQVVSSNQKRAKGRKSQADNPIATIALMAQNAIVRGNRNKMKQKLYSFVANRETSLASVRNVWYVRNANNQWEPQYADTSNAKTEAEIKQIMEQFELDMQKLEAQGDAFKGKLKQGMGYRANRKQKDEHVVTVMVNGKEYGIYINGNPRAAQAVNGLTNAEGIDDAGKWIDNLKRYYGAGLTSWNPDFIIPNFVRDSIHATTMTFLDKGAIAAAKYILNTPKVFSQVFKEVSGVGVSDPKLHQYFEEFVTNGGETGYTAIHTLEDYKKEYDKLMNEAKGIKSSMKNGLKEGISKLSSILEAANRIAEDVNRFNAYVTSREEGYDIVKSIDAAKNITVNFNRKGALASNTTTFGKVASLMSRWILFFNPGVQGIYQLVTKSKLNPQRAKVIGATILASGFFMPMINELLVAAAGGDDEDDYWNQTDFKRRNNWMLFTGDGYVTIPLPPVLRELYGIGDIMYGIITGHITPSKAIYDTLKQIQSAVGFINLLPNVSHEPDMINYVKGFAPDVAAPILDIVTNTNFMGSPIAKWTDYNEFDPEYMRVYKGVSPVWKELSMLLNEVGGKEGLRSNVWGNFINPAMMEHLITSYTGGIGKTINNVIGMALDDKENIDLFRKTPILPRFYTPNDEKTVQPAINRKYYDFNYEYNRYSKALKKYEKAIESGEHPEWQKHIDEMEKDRIIEFINYFKAESKVLKKLTDKLKADSQNKELERELYDKKAEIATNSFRILRGN